MLGSHMFLMSRKIDAMTLRHLASKPAVGEQQHHVTWEVPNLMLNGMNN
jgi:hypothetical protein